ncbi:MAG: hypothetical protein KC635_16020 [Myxococcales bacterium]|nr:hypothetical protein [Myxococcales bacterium]
MTHRSRLGAATLLALASVLALAPACGDDGAGGTADTLLADTAAPADTLPPADTLSPADTLTPADTAPADVLDTDTADASPPDPTPVCVAIRGNGELITAHFAALARIAETYGPFEGVAGGSSASITSFLTESMHMHPLLRRCGERDCTRAEAGARLGLLYKSLFGYLGAMTERDEAVAVGRILAVVELAQERGIGELIASGRFTEAFQALVTLLESDDVKDLVNPEVLTLLRDSPDKTKHVTDVWNALKSFGGFSAADPIIFVRPGLVHFAGLARQIGRIGSFYAGYGAYDEAAWSAFLDGCAGPGVGLLWPSVAALDAGGETCGARFAALLAAWRADFIPREDTAQNRLDDRVGAHLRALVVTSVLTGQAATAFATARAAYVQAGEWTLPVAFDDVKIGYWGRAIDVSGVVANTKGFPDLRSSKAMSLGQATWREVLPLSPAEPGLARAYELDGTRVSAGGWPDLEPVLALENAGCERVIYLTRRGGESSFAQAVAGLLGMSEAQRGQLYDLADPASSFSLSLSEAAGVWCTTWDAFGATDLAGIMADAYGAPLEIHDATLVPAGPAYSGATTSASLPGCTPGVLPATR